MIDLTKPIRRKDYFRHPDARMPTLMPEETRVADLGNGIYAVLEVWDPDKEYTPQLMSIEFLEKYFENDVEPRKPREWWTLVYNDGTALELRPPTENWINARDGEFERVRLIEWPEGAPLPAWPTKGEP